jgi:hypothetical protein
MITFKVKREQLLDRLMRMEQPVSKTERPRAVMSERNLNCILQQMS